MISGGGREGQRVGQASSAVVSGRRLVGRVGEHEVVKVQANGADVWKGAPTFDRFSF